MHTRKVPCFLVTRIGLKIHDVYLMGKIKFAWCSLSIFALMAMALIGCNGVCFHQMGGASGKVSI